jgi:hypothetical protein
MSQTVKDRISALRDKWERLSQRERTLVGAAGITFVVLLTLVGGFFITDGLSTFEERNADMRQALKDLDTQRESYLKLKAKSSQLENRIPRTPLQLQGFLEQAAKDAGVDIPESNERQAPAGKRWIERAVDLHLRQVTLDSLARFCKAIETGPNLVVVTALTVRTRDDKHEQLEVDMTVSTYERATDKNKPKGDKS